MEPDAEVELPLPDGAVHLWNFHLIAYIDAEDGESHITWKVDGDVRTAELVGTLQEVIVEECLGGRINFDE